MGNRRYQGKVVRWKGDRGFGFLQTNGINKDIFLHISALPKSGRSPQVGDTIYFNLKTEAGGKYKAVQASYTPQRQTASRPPKRSSHQTHRSKRQYSRRSDNSSSSLVKAIIIGIVAFGGIFAASTLWENRSQLTTTSSSPATPQPATPVTSQANCRIKGNISYPDKKKFYHKPGDRDYAKVEIFENEGERWFCSEQEAINAGWQAANPANR